MTAKIVFKCDHSGCESAYTIDTSNDAHAHSWTFPIDLAPVIRYLTDPDYKVRAMCGHLRSISYRTA